MFCSPKKIAENQSNQSPIYQSRLHLDCTNGGNPRAIEWNATGMHQLWEHCNPGSILPIDGQSIQNWGFQLWFAINPNLTADRHDWALTRGQVQTDAWGPLQSSRGPTIQNTRSPGLSQSWCNRWSRLLQSTWLHRNSRYLQSCYNSDRLPFNWTLIRKWARGFRPLWWCSVDCYAFRSNHYNAYPIFYNHEDWWRIVQFQGIPGQSSNPCAIHSILKIWPAIR